MNNFLQALKTLWDSVKSNPFFVTVSSAAFGALLDLAQDYLTTGQMDMSSAGIKKMSGYVLTAVIAAVVHLYRPHPRAAQLPPGK